ncbi:MAG: hypothetical protein ACRC28_15740 [Clostridium sp.]|uniref:hypothetical protein n=1 Tax=Clostridium sp. TaxID=1506 RepID=UPI003F3D562E
MDKDYLDNIEEFDLEKLPKIDLENEKIDKIKENIIKGIERLKEKNKNIGFAVSLEDVLKIKESLGEDDSKPIFGIENAKLMRKILIGEIKRKYNIKNEDIVYEYKSRSRGEETWVWESIVYNEFILTKKGLLIIGLDADIRVKMEKYASFSEIKKVGKMEGEEENNIFGTGIGILDLKDGVRLYMHYKHYNMEKEFCEFVGKLKEFGIKEDNGRSKKMNRFIMGMYIFTVSIIAYVLCDFIKGYL